MTFFLGGINSLNLRSAAATQSSSSDSSIASTTAPCACHTSGAEGADVACPILWAGHATCMAVCMTAACLSQCRRIRSQSWFSTSTAFTVAYLSPGTSPLVLDQVIDRVKCLKIGTQDCRNFQPQVLTPQLGSVELSAVCNWHANARCSTDACASLG